MRSFFGMKLIKLMLVGKAIMQFLFCCVALNNDKFPAAPSAPAPSPP